ncbi:hypothetical protein BAY61_12495 [Prauserella marina]|uniref:Uncharacterized protein n=1 Tax=Prauserella marina TaxID=530584 RepID=A0A222VPK4_9PSEU|nr:hypothetical protein [Prauserella marina]ASR35683.1 hypothetical protein BAY61_12495 [Prauserella marina]PWV84441.1 hypothetical protein DES30_101458 [Prauserella marina]SDC22485.1 hypothetical protein SAMN05421630_101879 [Prauserella marina]
MPAGVSPFVRTVIAALGIYDDRTWASRLAALEKQAAGTDGDGLDDNRFWILADWRFRRFVCLWLETGESDESKNWAAMLRAIDPVGNAGDALQLSELLRRVATAVETGPAAHSVFGIPKGPTAQLVGRAAKGARACAQPGDAHGEAWFDARAAKHLREEEFSSFRGFGRLAGKDDELWKLIGELITGLPPASTSPASDESIEAWLDDIPRDLP